MRASVAGLVFGSLIAGSAFGQYIISAHSGLVQYVEGTAYINDVPAERNNGQLPSIKDNQVFRTAEGKAEVLLTPGVFLRLAENSSVRMVSSKLTDTRVEVLTGSAMVEVDDLAKDDSIMLLSKGTTILLVKHGLYRVDAEAGIVKVYDGEAILKGETDQVTLKKGKEAVLSGALVAQNFDPKDDDELYRWSDRRSGYLAKANVSSASGLSSSFGGYGGYGSSGLWGRSGWLYNSLFGMYTYVPYDGFLYSPFGYGFYSPYSVWQAPYYGGGGGGGFLGGGGKGIAGVSHSGSTTGKHAPFIPARGSSGSSGAAYASRGGAASSSGGGAAVGAARSSGGSVGFSGASAGAAHAAAPVSAGRGR